MTLGLAAPPLSTEVILPGSKDSTAFFSFPRFLMGLPPASQFPSLRVGAAQYVFWIKLPLFGYNERRNWYCRNRLSLLPSSRAMHFAFTFTKIK